MEFFRVIQRKIKIWYNFSVKYNVLVKPGSKKGPLVEKTDENLVVFLREKPHDGEANEALIKILAKYFDIPKTSIKIINGAKSRQKVIELPE